MWCEQLDVGRTEGANYTVLNIYTFPKFILLAEILVELILKVFHIIGCDHEGIRAACRD